MDGLLDSKSDETNWRRISPKMWSNKDVLDWVYYQAACDKIRMKDFSGERYQDIDGERLCSMTLADFVAKDPESGELLYMRIRELIHIWHISVSNQTSNHSENKSWRKKHPDAWNNAEVLDWVFHIAELNEIDLKTFTGEKYQNVDGQELGRMSFAEFIRRDPSHGEMICNSFQHLANQSIFVAPAEMTNFEFSSDAEFGHLSGAEIEHLNNDLFPTWNSDNILNMDFSRRPSPPIPSSVELMTSSEKRSYDWSESDLPRYHSMQPASAAADAKRLKCNANSNVHSPRGTDQKEVVAKPKQATKMRLWKFMRDLLDNPAYNPEYIRWESKQDGIFRIVSGRSKAIADLWGKIKNNPTMTFDKLGRSLRWCRANNGLFSAIPKNGAFPKKLCFRFKTSQID